MGRWSGSQSAAVWPYGAVIVLFIASWVVSTLGPRTGHRPAQVDDVIVTAMVVAGIAILLVLARQGVRSRLLHVAMHDPLTGLPSRSLLHDRFEQALRVAQRNTQPLAVLLLDLDGFKVVNEMFGHHYGDLLLRQLGPRLSTVLRDSDTVARSSGDEFAIIAADTDRMGAELIAGRVAAALEQPFDLDGHIFDARASAGIAIAPEHGTTVSTLLQRAGLAMSVAKRQEAAHIVYDPSLDRNASGRLPLVHELRKAVEHDELILHYQPKVNLKTGRVDSVEALVRWQHPQYGLLPPDEFIALAEQTRLITLLTGWVIERALYECRRWHDVDLPLRVAVNLSTHNLRDSQLVQRIADMLAQHGLPPDALIVELTEGSVMADPFRAITVLSQIHELGVGISIDDFVTGYSSLGYLKRLPVDEIKIDRSFVLDMLRNDSDYRIVRATINLGHDLGLKTVAEGVEDKASWDTLATLHCDLVQGYYLTRPLPPEQCTRWLHEWSPRIRS